MKPIRYTRHARNRMRWRRISEPEVESAVAVPDFVEHLSETRLNVWKILAEGFLKVAYVETNEEIIVITAAKKKKGWR